MRVTFDESAQNLISGLNTESESFFEAATYPVKYLLKLYQTTIMEREMQEITVQPSKARADVGKRVIVREPSTSELGFQELPVNLQLKIFSYLDARSVCTAALTCHYWSMLSEDKVLWMNLMQRNMHKWRTMGYQSCPSTYMEARSDLTLKQIYLRCCPECRSLRRTRDSFKSIVFYNLQNLSSFFKRKSPRLVMFGPGLESDTKGLVHQLLWDSTSPFEVTGMFPGQFDGIGSGVCLKFDNMELNLITLYASNKKEREANAQLGKQRFSKLLAPTEGAHNDDDNEDDNKSQQSDTDLSHPVKELCKTIDAFIYVVDSSADSKRVNVGDTELAAMMNENWTQAKAPLLVLSCVSTATTTSLSCATVVELLQLRRLNRPWQVNAACVENLDGVLSGIKWLLNSSS
ncbi:hypothetical protein ACROYT_G043595 [Oculina patagonica]